MLIADDGDSLLLQCKSIIKANGDFRGKIVPLEGNYGDDLDDHW